MNPVSLAAHTAAYQKGREWLEELKLYLDENFAFLDSFLKKYFPEAVYNIPEATYLAWIDMRNCLPGVENLPDFFANKAGVLLEGGDGLFVGNANGYIRLNLAMPRAMLECGLNRMKDAMEQYRKEGQEK